MEREKTKKVTIRPFDLDKRFTKFSNPLIDHVMPSVSPSAWKVLTVIIRQTVGWVEDRQTGKRKEWDQISYSQLKEKTGIGSDATITKALRELQQGGYIDTKPGAAAGKRYHKQSILYRLKPEIKVEISPEQT